MTPWQAEEIRQALREAFGPYESLELLRAFNDLQTAAGAPVENLRGAGSIDPGKVHT